MAMRGTPRTVWTSLTYVTLFSMLIGFVFWYRSLAKGGITAVGQLKLLPFFDLSLAATFLHDLITWMMLAVIVAVIPCVFGVRKFAQ